MRLPVCVAELSLSQSGKDDELTEATESLTQRPLPLYIAALPLSAATVSLVSTAALPLDSSGHAAPKTKTFEGKDFEDKNLRFVVFSIYFSLQSLYLQKSPAAPPLQRPCRSRPPTLKTPCANLKLWAIIIEPVNLGPTI